jgi:hypothetical protein
VAELPLEEARDSPMDALRMPWLSDAIAYADAKATRRNKAR